jgi:hypothetical protein
MVVQEVEVEQAYQVVVQVQEQQEQLTPVVVQVVELLKDAMWSLSRIMVDQVSVVARVPGSTDVTVSPGTNTVTTLPAPAGGCKVATFTVSGNLTVAGY